MFLQYFAPRLLFWRTATNARPPDINVLGDLTYSNFIGGLIHLSMWQLVLKMSNGCGIWMNFIDELMRQVAHNLQIWTPAGIINKYNMCGESLNFSGQTLYDWEGLGLLREPASKEEWQDIDEKRATDTETIKTTAELQGNNMSPFYRFEQFEGWLGQGGMRNVKALPKTDNKIFEMDNGVTTAQLYRQSLNVSGTFTLQAAGGFALERTIDIPCYQNKYEPFDTVSTPHFDGY